MGKCYIMCVLAGLQVLGGAGWRAGRQAGGRRMGTRSMASPGDQGPHTLATSAKQPKAFPNSPRAAKLLPLPCPLLKGYPVPPLPPRISRKPPPHHVLLWARRPFALGVISTPLQPVLEEIDCNFFFFPFQTIQILTYKVLPGRKVPFQLMQLE